MRSITTVLYHVTIRPHWEIIAYWYRAAIVAPSEDLRDMLEDYSPDTIVVGFTPLGITTGIEPIDMIMSGDLSKIVRSDGSTLLEKLPRYVWGKHVSIIATMGPINGFELTECDPTKGGVV